MKFEIHLADKNVTGGSVPIAWCLDRELLNDIKKSKRQAWVLFVMLYKKNKREFRRLVPLQDMMTYLSFQYSGPVEIFATILKGSKKALYNDFLRPGIYTQYVYEHITFDDEINSYSYLDDRGANAKSIEIEVPEGIFAKEPPKWEQAWVNYFFDMRPFDQCNYRRRRIFAYTIQPLLFLLIFILKCVMIFIFGSMLLKSTSLKYLFHPMQYNLTDTFEGLWSGDSVLLCVKEDQEWQLPLRLCLLPITWLNIAIVFLPFLTNQNTAIYTISGIFVTVITISAMLFILNKKWAKSKIEKPVEIEIPEPILCDDKPKNVKQILKRGPIKLWMQHIKSKVCRPFQG